MAESSLPYNYTPQTPFTDTALKQEQLWALDYTRKDCLLYRLLERGVLGGAPSEYPSGGYKSTFELVVGNSASGGLPDSNNSFAAIGRYNESNSKVSITPFFDYGRATITQQEMETLITGTKAYYDRKQLKLRGILDSRNIRFSAQMYGTGKYGQMTQVTATGGGITVGSASTEYTPEVKQVERLPMNQDILILTSAGAPISDMPLAVVTALGNTKSGTGTIKIKFPTYTSGSPVIPNDAIFAVPGAINTADSNANLFYLNGLKEMVGTSAHPRAEGNNDSNSTPQYTSEVLTLSSGQKLDIWKMLWLLQRIKKNAVGHQMNVDAADIRLENFDEQGYVKPAEFVWLIHPDTRLQLLKSFYDGKAEVRLDPGFKMGSTIDEGIRYDTFMGVPIMEDLLCDPADAYLMHMKGIARSVLYPWGPMPFTTAEWVRTPTTGNYELLRRWAQNYIPIFRDVLGRISAASGETLGVSEATMIGGN